MKVLILFRIFKETRYSIVPLIASLENEDLSHHINIHIVTNSPLKFLKGYSGQDIIIAYSFMSHQWENVKEEWRIIKEKFGRDITIIAGGPHATGKPKELIKWGADVVCCFEGEVVFPKIIKKHLRKNLKKPSIVYEKPKVWEESFPFPQITPMISPIEISRGCPFGCKYCQTPVLKGRKMRHKTIEVITEAVKFMVKHGLKDIRFITPNGLAFGSIDGLKINIEAIQQLLYNIKRNIPKEGRIFFGSFPSEVRPEFISKESVRIIKKYCHNKKVVFGAQSGSENMLVNMNRGHSIEDVLNACDVLLEYSMEPVVDFMIGLPDENEEDVLKTINLMEKLTNMGAKVHLHYFMPLPGTPWGKRESSPIPAWALKKINRLISSGKLFGQWMHQMEIAKRHNQQKNNENL